MSDALTSLRQALIDAAGSPFALDAAFLTSGLNDPSVTVPPDYDTWIQQAFFTAAASDFLITIQASNVGEIVDDHFTVTDANVPFVGASAPIASPATLIFALRTEGDNQALVVQIQSRPQDWTWSNSFAFLGGFPFDQLDVADTQFVFSTDDGTYPWFDPKGSQVFGGAKQNLTAQLPFPTIAAPFLALIDGLSAPSGNLLLTGALDLSTYDAETVLMPTGTLSATIQDGAFTLVYLNVSNPSITLTIPPPEAAEPGVPPEESDEGDQAPLLSISSLLAVGDESGPDSPYHIQIDVLESSDGSGQSTESYDVNLVATGEGTPLTPATVVELVGGSGSYLSATPAVLQQFLAFVSLQGLAFSGMLANPASPSLIAVDIGSSPNTSLTIIPDPTGQLDFTIKSFALQWSVSDPFNSQTRRFTYDFTTQFTLATAVFKGPEGEGDGVFEVQFTSDQQYVASFEGSAKLSDFLGTLSGGAVTLEGIVEAELSGIRLSVNVPGQSFTFFSAFSLELPFLTVGGEPVLALREGEVNVAAKTPTQGSGDGRGLQAQQNTVWQSSIGGQFSVGPLFTTARIEYDGFETPARWNLEAALAQPFDVEELINQFFSPGGSYVFPDFLPGNLTILNFGINAMLPAQSGSALATTYDIRTRFNWLFTFGDQSVGIDPANLTLSYRGDKPVNQQFSGSADGRWIYDAIGLELLMGYTFVPTALGNNQTLFVEWEGFRATWRSLENDVTFSLKGWSIGTLIQALVRTLGNPYFTLPSPWSLLNQVSLDGLEVIVSLQSGQAFSQRLSAKYTLSSPIELGFVRITALTFRRDTNGKVTLAITGSSPISDQLGDLMDPNKGQDVNNLPTVPGRGQENFKLFLLAVGQRIGITGSSTFANTKEAICALSNVPSTTGRTNPVDPNADQGSATGLPYYNRDNNWLIAFHLGLLKVGPAWTVDAMVVFNDPDLYGLRLALGGPKAGGLAGLSIDILYKKITDDIGVFQIEFTFPDAIRNLNFGAVSITLPQIGVKVFTNGDFFIDIGFPYNLDFRRSFSFSAIVYGVPVLGSGGLYFGKLSNATSTKVPVTDKGTFDPVIEFGIGLQLGLGYNFQKGPLSAGFALTVFGIVEGVYAAWHPYDPARALVAREASGGALQSDYYFKLSGTVGVIGLLYGSVDFKIISAAVNVKITLSLQLTYESFREIPIVATATVDVTARVKIDLGLFSITLKFSFSMRVSATFQIGSPEQAPWDPDDRALEALRARSLMTAGPDAAVRRARQLRPRARRLAEDRAFAALDRPTLRLMAGAQFTVAAPSGSVDPADNQGAFVLLLAMDAPDPAAEAAPTLATLAANAGAARAVDADPPSSFELLCTAYFPWLIDNLQGATADSIAAVVTSTVTREELEAYVTKLADVNDPSLNIGDLLTFLGDAFTLDIENPPTAQASGLKAALDAGSVLLPAFDGLTLTAPKASGDGTTTVTFETYATATPGYRALVSQQLTEVAARIEAENQESPRSALGAEEASADSLASTVFVDAFNLIGSQLLQTAEDLLAAFPYRLTSTTQLSDIVSTINGYGSGNDIKPEDVALPNADHPLGGAIGLRVPVPADVLQSTDTLATVAARYTDDAGRYATTPAQLIVANGMQRSLRAGAVLKLQGQSGPETVITRAGDTFQEIADALKITLEALSTQSALYDATDLLAPTTTLLVPPVAYTAAGAAGAASSDTLRSVGALFAVDVPTLADANVDVPGLFAVDADEGIVTVASLQAAPVDVLLQAVIATGEIGQTAALVSRFLTYGLRLPKADGLTLSSDFLYPTDAPDFGLYQLTGQQVPTPTGADSYALGLARVGSSHGVDLGFIGFDNDPSGTGTTIDLSEAYVRLDATATWAQGGNFKPTPTLEALPLATRAPKPFPAASFAFLSSADLGAFLSLTQRGAAAVADADGPQPQPILWHLPPGLLTVTAHRQASIEAATGGFDAALPLLPALQPQRGTSSPATGQTDYADLTHWAWATRVDVQIKRLPAANVEATEGIVDEPLPRGPASQPSLPNTYELVGTNANNTRLLERILVATDALGEDVISGLFLVYNPDGGGAPRLVTPADADFLAFITQTNLSTETNPPAATRLRALAADTAAPRGIANAPGEFIKLLWELSVVRSGGYYLYYEQTESGEGLPASIFDADSTGDLTLLVVYDAQAGQATSLDLHVPDFVNAVLSGDAVDPARDVVQMLSTSAGAPVTSGGQTLRALSAIYGPGPGRIAEANPDVALATGAKIPIDGLLHQLTPAEVAAGNPLDAVAAHYAAGAETPITGQMIADFNPGVTAAVGAVYLIPPFTYVVAAAPDPTAAPGNTFAAMAAYYPSSIDQLATCAADVANLFPSSTQLRIDGQMFDLRPELGPANVGIALERANLGEPVWPDNPTQPQKDAYAQATMFSLYSLLSTGLADNVFYDVSPFSQPFGPQDFSDAPSDASAFDSHARRLARRRRAFDAAVEADYTYRQSIGIPAALAAVNAAPAGAAAPLDAALNPYLGVGAPTQAALRWQDLFGNTTVTPFVAPAADYAGALNGAVVPLRYGDRLIGLSDWRNTRASYVYSAGGGSPALALGIALDAAAYAGDDGAARAQEDFGLYRQIYFQLNQNYDGQKVPGVDGQAVAMQLHNSLTGGQPIDLDDPQSAQVRDFARDAALYLNAIAIGAADPPPAPETTLTFPVDVAGIVDDTVVPLDVNLTFVRQAVLTEPTVAALADGLAVESPIGPTPDPGGDTAAYTTFAAALEAIFQTDAWFLRVGEGLREAGATDDARDQQLFTVRFGKQAGQGVYFTVGDAPSYYAPAPVATTLESDTVTIAQYPSGTTEQLDFTAVDLNLWFQTYLDGIDTFLSATYSPHAFILDQLEGVTDPLRDGQLGRVLQTKQSLADTISASVLPILSTSATDDATRASAQETLRQRLLNQIGVAYAAGAVTVFGLDSVSGAPPSTPAGPPNLYGQPGGTIAGQAIDNENYSLSAARVPLGPVETPQGATVAPRLAFVFSSKNVTTQPFVALDQATLSISHMEIDRTTVPGIEGYVQSRWLAFVSGPFDVPLGASTLDIPVLNRTLPTPPTMLAQSADKHVLNPSTPTELAQWDYAFRYLNQQAAQDAVLTEIQLNRPQSAGLASRALADGPSLFETLAQFITTYPAILADFNAHLVAIDGAGGDAPNQAPAAVAVKAFADAVENVAIAYAAHMQGVAQALAIAPQLITVRFRSLLSNADGQARSDLLNLTINDQAATWNPGTGTITAGAITLPQTVIEIDPGDYEPEPVTPLPPNVDVSYRYRSRAPSGEPTYLPYDQAQQDPNRTIAMRGLDALAHQSGWSSIEVERNLVLFPLADIGSVSTNPAFRFQTPVVRFANPIIPRLVYASYDLAATPGGSTTLQDELDAFFAALYAEGTGAIDVKISMEGLYAYALVSVDGVPRVRLPVDLLPPTLSPVDPSQPPAFVAPFADAVDTWRSANNPTTSGDPTLDIRFEAFSNESTTKQPLLKIDRLVYAIDD